MSQKKHIPKTFCAFGLLSGIALLVWAFSYPYINRSRAEELVNQAQELLSHPTKSTHDIDAVDCSGAVIALEYALELVPSNGQARRDLPMARGCAALRRGDFILAAGSLRAAARQNPNDPRIHRWLGSLAMAQDEHTQALGHFQRSLELDETLAPSRIGYSDALAELGRTDEALQVLTSDLIETTGFVETRRGIILEELGNIEAARRAYLSAIRLSPHSTEPLNNLSALEQDQGNLDRAWELQQQALEISPNDPLLLLNAGLLAIVRGQDQQAHRYLRRAAELDQESADPSRAIADHLLVTGHAQQALEEIASALERFPRDAALHNSLGNTLTALGRTMEAAEAYQDAIELDGNLSAPHNGLAALMLSSGDLDGAETELNRAARLNPSDPQVRRNLDKLRQRREQEQSRLHHNLAI